MIIDLNDTLYSYDKLVTDANSLARKYEQILKCVTIGKSHDNRDIILLSLGLGQHHLICCAGVHGRETINPIVLMKIVEYYSDLYVNHKQQKQNLREKLNNPTHHIREEYEQMLYGTCIYELLQTYTIHFVPLLNPDGYMISLTGFEAIRDLELREKCILMQIPNYEWKYNARGVDINRNFPSRHWASKDNADHPASENETQALIRLFQDYNSKGFLDFHSRGKSIYYYRSVMSDRYNNRQYDIACCLQKITNYELELPENELDTGDSGGNTVHYYSEHFNKPALTIETVEEIAEFPLDKSFRYSTFEELKLVIVEFGSMVI